MHYTILIKDDKGATTSTITEVDIAASIRAEGKNTQVGLQQVEFVLSRVLHQRAADSTPRIA